MKTYNRICIKDWDIKAINGDTFEVKRGKEYLTSEQDEEGYVRVLSSFWAKIPVSVFAGEIIFTKEDILDYDHTILDYDDTLLDYDDSLLKCDNDILEE